MYNGQVAKGFAHLVIFAVLVFLSDHASDLFGVFVAGWIFYQAFEAYHTAKARRDGLPLPDPFGLNDIGERMGFGKNWPGSTSRPAATSPDWVGYVPPTQYGNAAAQQAVAAEEIRQQAYRDAGINTAPPADSQQTSASWGSTHYQAPYTAPYAPTATEATAVPAPAAPATLSSGCDLADRPRCDISVGQYRLLRISPQRAMGISSIAGSTLSVDIHPPSGMGRRRKPPDKGWDGR